MILKMGKVLQLSKLRNYFRSTNFFVRGMVSGALAGSLSGSFIGFCAPLMMVAVAWLPYSKQSFSLTALIYTLIFGLCVGAILGFISGLFMGAIFGTVIHLLKIDSSRLTRSLWFWIPIGIVLGAIGGFLIVKLVLLFFSGIGFEFLGFAYGGISGFMAGPIFEHFYISRYENRKVKPAL